MIYQLGEETPIKVAWHKRPQHLSRCICRYCLRAISGESLEVLGDLYNKRLYRKQNPRLFRSIAKGRELALSNDSEPQSGKTSWTPGPWHTEGSGGCHDGGSTRSHPHFRGKIEAENGTEIVSFSSFLGVQGRTPQEAEANAGLIAAAPETRSELNRMTAQRDALLKAGERVAYQTAVWVARGAVYNPPNEFWAAVRELRTAITDCEPVGI